MIKILVKKRKNNECMRKENSMISYRTCFSSISDFGYKLDILKSGIQKYLRRRELDNDVDAVAHLDWWINTLSLGF